VWALRDINFDVRQGEVLGIIGRNGAGKSTLLKILSKVTAPTTGDIKIKGRIASLLEVGTGFHPDLSGRDNIYLNGAILGMTKKEIASKFDEMVDFAGVERYIDTPVKRYSSGMYVRLAFAVAAHLEPEILIVDEVLAVGDAEFQKKCLGKMKDVSEKDGRTILFVSHNMDAIARLCTTGLYLKNGKVVEADKIDIIISSYLQSEKTVISSISYSNDEMPGDDIVRLAKAEVVGVAENNAINFRLDETVGIKIYFEVLKPTGDLVCGFNLYTARDVHILTSHDTENAGRYYQPGVYGTIVWIPANLLAEGIHYCGIALMSYKPFTIHLNDVNKVFFNMVDVMVEDSVRDRYAGVLPGLVRPLLQWKTVEQLF
jgi:lipopolysaccharide transport system ATP-binding protein